MAMLAEPRQRKRYNLVPRGKALYEDESRFGTKMLEKMGWKKGDGLGASCEGSKDFVRIRYKNDAFGLGFEERDDQWTQHEESFNGVLRSLNNEENDASNKKENDDVDDNKEEGPERVGFGFHNAFATDKTTLDSKTLKDKISGISLEERSKQSKARVHYKKFTKGKDLSQYSEKDLANIFGKKAIDEQANDFYKNLSNTFGVIAEEGSCDLIEGTANVLDADSVDSATKKKDKKKKKKNLDSDTEKREESVEENPNTQKLTFTSNLSVQDYFKMKMEAIKNNKANPASTTKEPDIKNSGDDEPTTELKRKKKVKKEDQNLEDNCLQNPVKSKSKKAENALDQEISCENDIEKQVKRSGNKKRVAEELAESFSEETTSKVVDSAIDCLEEVAKKKSKKVKNKFDLENYSENGIQEQVEKRSKKDKNKANQNSFSGSESENNAQIVKKSKKSKNRDTENSTEFQLDKKPKVSNIENCHIQEPAEIFLEDTKSKAGDFVIDCMEEVAKKKSKKSKKNSDLENVSENEDLDRREKKSKKDANKANQNCLSGSESEKDTQIVKKAKKSKKRDAEELAEEPAEQKLKKSKKTAETANSFEYGKEFENEEIILSETKSKKKKDKSKNKNEADLLNDNKTPADTIDLVKEPTGKNKKEVDEVVEVIEIIDSDNDEPSNAELEPVIKGKKNKSKKSEEPSADEEASTAVCPSNSDGYRSAEIPKEDVSPSAKNIPEFNPQDSDLEELKKNYQAFNTYPISSFCAEKFRNTSLNNFKGSSLSKIVGYGLNSDLQLEIFENKYDEGNIAKLWANSLKTQELGSRPRDPYQKYFHETIKARKAKETRPKLHVKTWKRKNAFQVV